MKKNKILTINVSSIGGMKSLYRVRCIKIHIVWNYHRVQEKDQRNLHVHYRVDHMENEEHRTNSIESVYSKSNDQ